MKKSRSVIGSLIVLSVLLMTGLDLLVLQLGEQPSAGVTAPTSKLYSTNAAVTKSRATATAATAKLTTEKPTTNTVMPSVAPPAGSGGIEVTDFVRVIDGDTLEITHEGSQIGVGLLGIDAPRGNTACGRKAANQLQMLVDRGVRLEEDRGVTFDDRKRRMYHAFALNGHPIATVPVTVGVVRAADGDRCDDRLAALEAEARASHRGCLWDGQDGSTSGSSKRLHYLGDSNY